MAPDKPENFVPMCRAFCETFDDALFDRILAAYKAWDALAPPDRPQYYSQPPPA